jgi:hypothetical protein
LRERVLLRLGPQPAGRSLSRWIGPSAPDRRAELGFLNVGEDFAFKTYVAAPVVRPTSSRAIRSCTVCSRRESTLQPVEPERPVECAGRDQQLGIEVVEVPAQRLLRTPALIDKVVAEIDQQLQLVEPMLAGARVVEARLSQRCPRDSEGVDRIGLASRPAGATPAPSASAAPAPTVRPPQAAARSRVASSSNCLL